MQESTDKKITVAILEDIPDIAENLSQVILGDSELQLSATFASSEEALKSNLAQFGIDVFLVDLGLPGLDGVHFIDQARKICPVANFMVHTISENGSKLWSALAAGATGYVLKGCADSEIIEGIKIVARGNTLLSPRMASKLIHFFGSVTEITTDTIPLLTKREIDILQGLRSGRTYEEIAESRFLSTHTVHTHVKNIYQKLKVNNKIDAIRKATIFDMVKLQ